MVKLDDAPIPKKKTSNVLPDVVLAGNAIVPEVAFICALVLCIIMPCNPSAVEFPATGFHTGCELPDVPGVYATSKFPLESTTVSRIVAVPPWVSFTAAKLLKVKVVVVDAVQRNPGAVVLLKEFTNPVILT